MKRVLVIRVNSQRLLICSYRVPILTCILIGTSEQVEGISILGVGYGRLLITFDFEVELAFFVIIATQPNIGVGVSVV